MDSNSQYSLNRKKENLAEKILIMVSKQAIVQSSYRNDNQNINIEK
jgi:hypothetical protein